MDYRSEVPTAIQNGSRLFALVLDVVGFSVFDNLQIAILHKADARRIILVSLAVRLKGSCLLHFQAVFEIPNRGLDRFTDTHDFSPIQRHLGGNPADVVLRDRALLLNTLLWMGAVLLIIYGT